MSLRLGLVFAVSLFAAACGGYSASPTAPAPVPSTGTGSTISVSIPTGASTLGQNAFAPDSAVVPVGTTVTWTNTDSVSHTSTSDQSGWNSGTLPPGGRFSFAFQTTGTFKYHCSIHPGMIGTVVVQ